MKKKQKLKDYRREYYKKYYAEKMLNNKTNYYEVFGYMFLSCHARVSE